jgi:hypothetical protein
MRNCVKIRPRIVQRITRFLVNGHPRVLWQAKVRTGGEGRGESAVVSRPGRCQAQDECIDPFITWRISLLQLLTRMHHTDPQLSTAKRQHRTHALNVILSRVALGRMLATAEITRPELETLLRVRDTMIERLEADHRWLAEREQEERKEKERLSKEREEEKVSGESCRLHFVEAQQTNERVGVTTHERFTCILLHQQKC